MTQIVSFGALMIQVGMQLQRDKFMSSFKKGTQNEEE